jgi:hypothetical protein
MAAGGKKKKGAERMGASTNLPGKSKMGKPRTALEERRLSLLWRLGV